MAKKTVAAKKRNVKVDAMGQLHVHSSFNNIIVCLANNEGQAVSYTQKPSPRDIATSRIRYSD